MSTSHALPDAADVEIPNPVLTPAGLPSTDSESGALDVNAKLVWVMVRYTALEAPLRPHVHEGETGFLWDGTLVSVLADTWPILRNPGSITAEVKLRINQYLKLTHNMVCLNRGSRPGSRPRRMPLWWVRADWSDRLEDFRVTTDRMWPEVENENEEVDAVFFATDPISAPVSQEPDPVEPKLYVCEYPGCTAGADGGAFTNTRANVMPLHRRNHEVTDQIVEAAARMLAAGVDESQIYPASVARVAGVHPSTVHQRFRADNHGELVARGRELLRQRGRAAFKPLEQIEAATPEPERVLEAEPEPHTAASPSVVAQAAVCTLRLAAYAERNMTALSRGVLVETIKAAFGGAGLDAIQQVEESGELISRQSADARGRGRVVWVAADPDAVLGSVGTAAVVQSSAGPLDFVAELQRLLADYAAKDQVIAAQNRTVADQDAQLAKQAEKLDGARSELDELRKLITPLINFTGGSQP